MDFERTRLARRKQKKINLVLNISIIIVALLILFVVYQIFFSSSEQAAVEDENDQEVIEEEEHEGQEEELDEENLSEPLDLSPIETEKATEKEREIVQEHNVNDRDIDREEDRELPQSVSNANSEGKWEPIGTVQKEPFVAVYDKNHVNWKEMTRALQVATGLGDDMIIWRIENGGDHQSAVGYVSTYENQNTPYQVRIEWVTNRGWKPVSVTQLSENPYLKNE